MEKYFSERAELAVKRGREERKRLEKRLLNLCNLARQGDDVQIEIGIIMQQLHTIQIREEELDVTFTA